jgi:hypothetical protein
MTKSSQSRRILSSKAFLNRQLSEKQANDPEHGYNIEDVMRPAAPLAGWLGNPFEHPLFGGGNSKRKDTNGN